MAESRTKSWILLLGILVFVATTLCHAQEPRKLFDVKTLPKEASPVLAPESAIIADPRAAQTKSAREVPEKSWFRRLLEGTAIGAATYNTEKQSDGRPPVNTYKARP